MMRETMSSPLGRHKFLNMARVLSGLLIYFCLFCVSTTRGMADSLRQAEAWLDCFGSKKWCLLNEKDQITKTPFKNVFVTGSKFIFLHGAARVDLLLMCKELMPWLYIETGTPVTYGELRIRYRVDPSGKIGYATAKHMRSGELFDVQDSMFFLRDIQSGEKLTAEFTDPLDGSVSTTTFNIEGTNTMMERMGCARTEK